MNYFRKILNYSSFLLIGIMLLGLTSCTQTSTKPNIPLNPTDFKFVTVTSQDTFVSLARQHLGDPQKDWLIAEFNGIRQIKAGQELIIPLKSFRPRGLTALGYQTIPVLSYHHFSKRKKDKLFIRQNEFEQQMQYLKDNGYRVITIDQMFEFLEHGQAPAKSVVITIDDGWRDFYDLGFPILKKFGYPATLFIQTELIDNKSKSTLNWAHVREMVESNTVDIQCHTKTHRKLNKRNHGESFQQYIDAIENDLIESKRIIKQKLGQDVKYLAYPYGEMNQLVVDLVKKAGYRGAFTVERGSTPFFTNNYRINRSMIYGHYSPSQFLKKFQENLTYFEAEKLASQKEPIDDQQITLQPVSLQQAKQYEIQGQLRTALFHWKMIRDLQRVGGNSEIFMEADQTITALERRLSEQADRHFQKGKQFFQAGNLDDAENEMLQAVLLNPEHKLAYASLKNELADEEHEIVEVQPGDTLKKIAQRIYGSSSKDFLVAHLNDIATPTDLRPGIKLSLPVLDKQPIFVASKKTQSQSKKKSSKKKPSKKKRKKIAKTKPKSKAKTKAKSKVKTKSRTKSKTKAKTKAKSKRKPKRTTKTKPKPKTVCGVKLTKSKRRLASSYNARGHRHFNNNKISAAKKAFRTAACLGHKGAREMLSVL